MIQKTRLCLWCVLTMLFMGACAGRSGSRATLPEPNVREPSVVDPSNPPRVRVEGLEKNAVLSPGGFSIRVHADHYPVGEAWQAIAVQWNEAPPRLIYESGSSVSAPEGLLEGANALRVYLVRSWGESLKNAEAFAMIPFFVGRRGDSSALDLSAPVLTLVSPRGTFSGVRAKSIPFDFLVHGTQLSPKRHRVLYTLNGEQREILAQGSYQFTNLVPGTYMLKVELADASQRPLKKGLVSSESVFTVQP